MKHADFSLKKEIKIRFLNNFCGKLCETLREFDNQKFHARFKKHSRTKIFTIHYSLIYNKIPLSRHHVPPLFYYALCKF